MKDEVLCLCGAWLAFELQRPSKPCFVAGSVQCPQCASVALITYRASPAGFCQPPEGLRYLRGLDLWRCRLLHTLAARGGVRFEGGARQVAPPISALFEWIHGETAPEGGVLH